MSGGDTHCSAVIVAAGSAQRMQGIDKLLAPLDGVPVLRRTVEALASAPEIAELIVVTRADRLEAVQTLCEGLSKPVSVVPGGKTRAESVLCGLSAAAMPYAAIHDGARALVTPEQIGEVVLAAYAHGAAMMVRRETLEKAGPMPEIYFLYYEELDWSVRIREQGRRIVYDPRCTVFHKESATTGQQSPLRSYCLTRNRLLFAWRNLRGGARLLSVAYQLCIAAPKNAVSALAHRRGDLAKAVCRGVRDFFTLKNKQA